MENFEVTSSPHLTRDHRSTRLMMLQVILALVPTIIASIVVFKHFAVFQLAVCVLTCCAAEWIFESFHKKYWTLGDNSAIVSGLILALSLPWNAPWYVPVTASIIAIGIGKAAYGGLGYNIFNPAMVGRAFVMISFATVMGGGAYQYQGEDLSGIVTQATPLTMSKSDGIPVEFQGTTSLFILKMCFASVHNGSLGEVSGLAILLGGLYLFFRQNGSWRITVGMLMTIFLFGMMTSPNENALYYGLFYLTNGAVLFGAFFIATDPVTSPITPMGHWYFGIGVGVLTMVFRLFSGYPEGVMFAVLLMNALTPLLNQITIPKPFGYQK